MTTAADISPEAVDCVIASIQPKPGTSRFMTEEAADMLRALRSALTADGERTQQYMRALQILLTDESGDLDYIKWYITEKVLTIEARNAIDAMEKANG